MTTSQQQVQSMAISAMSVSVFATVLGVMLASMETMTLVPGMPSTEKAIADLRTAFGADMVDPAIKKVGKGDMIALAHEIENAYIIDMKKRYGEANATAALNAAIPGDLRGAREIAAVLAGQARTPAQIVQKQVQVHNIIKKRVRQAAQPQFDTKTGTVYKSKAAAGMAVATSYGLSNTETFVWYEVIKKDPKRFRAATAAETAKAGIVPKV